METNKWKTTDKELPPSPMVSQIESMIETIRGTIISLKKEVNTLKEEQKETDA